MQRPAFVEVPLPSGGTLTAVVANRNGLSPVDLNGQPHIGLLLSVNSASATIAVMTDVEADVLATQLTAAAQGIRQRRIKDQT